MIPICVPYSEYHLLPLIWGSAPIIAAVVVVVSVGVWVQYIRGDGESEKHFHQDIIEEGSCEGSEG